MKDHSKARAITTTALATLFLSGCSTIPGNPASTDDDTITGSFTRQVYGSVGMGASRLEPSIEEGSSWTVNDRVEPAGQITLGADLSKTLSVEMHSADLGSVGLSPQGRINYHMNGVSALIYTGKNRDKRNGLSAYGRIGYGAMDNSAIGEVRFARINDQQVLVGAGAEYGLKNGLGLRGELIVFDRDAQFAQLGVIYRLAPSTKFPLMAEAPSQLPTPVMPAPVSPIPVTPTQVEEIAAVSRTITPEDNDLDGIEDTLDECPGTEPGIAVNVTGCALFNGVIDGVNFEPSSAKLTATAQQLLDNVVATLSENPDVMISIGAHTDNQGDDDFNMSLSRDRAINVATYLIHKGVPKNLMSARAFGELLPIADNESSAGKAQNRRVELVASRIPIAQ